MEKESEQSYLGWLQVVVRFAHLPAGPRDSLPPRTVTRCSVARASPLPIGMRNPVSSRNRVPTVPGLPPGKRHFMVLGSFLLPPRVDLLAIDAHRFGSGHAEADLRALDLHYSHRDVAIDDDLFADPS